ncbi:MAG: 50S ribosomal protein L18 [Anaerolineales bacterium]|nr:50S ribosomal protein L18 [Anaerolineales bacterium]
MSAKSRVARKRRHHRMRHGLTGTAERPRLNVYRSLENIYVQVIDDETGRTLASASTIDKALASDMAGKEKIEQANLVGKTIAERAKAVGITQVVFDRGGFLYHGRIKALAEGAREGGLEF